MPIEVLSFLMSSKDYVKRLQCQLVLQCAPFLKGIKVASIMNMGKSQRDRLDEVLSGTAIQYKILGETKDRGLVFLYRRKELEKYLHRSEVCSFLESYGYEIGDMDRVISRLTARVCQYSDGQICFPHEIGAFLDYPIDDVRCFIEKGGKDCQCAGYWKVYNNVHRAQMTFFAYDKAKTSAVNEFLAGKSIKDITYIAAQSVSLSISG